jgi:hypothetical protein
MSVPTLGAAAYRRKQGLLRYPTALLAIVCLIITICLWLLNKDSSSRSAGVVFSSSYEAAAAANLTAYRNR